MNKTNYIKICKSSYFVFFRTFVEVFFFWIILNSEVSLEMEFQIKHKKQLEFFKAAQKLGFGAWA